MFIQLDPVSCWVSGILLCLSMILFYPGDNLPLPTRNDVIFVGNLKPIAQLRVISYENHLNEEKKEMDGRSVDRRVERRVERRG